jgi:hypothetical protein
MPDRAVEKRHLALAEWHVATAERWLDRQQGRVDRLIASGRDATEAERLRGNMAHFLDAAREQRRLILRRLNQIVN